MANVWPDVDPYWMASRGGATINAKVIWLRRSDQNMFSARGHVKSFEKSDRIGLEGLLDLPVPDNPQLFHAIQLNIQQMYGYVRADESSPPALTRFTLTLTQDTGEQYKESYVDIIADGEGHFTMPVPTDGSTAMVKLSAFVNGIRVQYATTAIAYLDLGKLIDR